jgi:Polyketide cyclase / dehydrase and lipid transport
MRYIKAALTGATALFIIITLLSLLIPSRARVSRTVLINASKDSIQQQVVDLKKWQQWHPLLLDSSVTIVYNGKSAGTGASCDITYRGKTTHLQVTSIDTAAVHFTLTAPGENDITNQLYFSEAGSSEQTRVDWNSTTQLHWYPWDKFYAIFIDKITGPGYEAALNGLKTFIEQP